jgi:hypothetical protein
MVLLKFSLIGHPDRMKNVIDEMIVKYSGNKQTFDSDTYVYAPDIDPDDNLDSPS